MAVAVYVRHAHPYNKQPLPSMCSESSDCPFMLRPQELVQEKAHRVKSSRIFEPIYISKGK